MARNEKTAEANEPIPEDLRALLDASYRAAVEADDGIEVWGSGGLVADTSALGYLAAGDTATAQVYATLHVGDALYALYDLLSARRV